MRLFLLCYLSAAISCSAFLPPNFVEKVNHAGIHGKEKMEPLCKQTTVSLVLRLANNKGDDGKVNVNLVDGIDAFSLASVGFGLIAFNFFVLANVRQWIFWFSSCCRPWLTKMYFCCFVVDGGRRTCWYHCPHYEYFWLIELRQRLPFAGVILSTGPVNY